MKDNKYLKQLFLSISILIIVYIVMLIIKHFDIFLLNYLIEWIFRLSIVYLIFSIVVLIVNSKKNNKKENIKKENENILLDNNITINNNKKEEKKSKKVFKTETDRLYEEAVKYYGKHYVKNRSKADVVDEYLNEDKSL